jgi:hypothetical protein
MTIILLTILAVTSVLGAAWFTAYWIDRVFWHLDNRLRTGDRYWRAWWK